MSHLTTLNNPPKADEIEISVFGPGYGECILIHVGDNTWFSIDCCIDKQTRQPKPIQYLRALGLNIEECVKLVIATHWHDDHVAGLSDLLKECTSAIFCCPSSLSGREFIALSEIYKSAPIGHKSGAYELGESLKIGLKRSNDNKKHMLKLIKADSIVCELPLLDVVVSALSPSDEMVRRCNEFMVANYAIATSKSNNIQRIVSSLPNDTAAAVRVKVGGRNILLGSDVEEENNPLVGWSSIINSHSTHKGLCSTYKVAHHGSKSGHHNDIWTTLLSKHPLSFITPFRLGRHKLPTVIDIKRIMSVTDNAFITADPNAEIKSKNKRSSKVESMIKSATNSRRAAIGNVGHIRWRAPIDDPKDQGSIELFDGAIPLKNLPI